MLNKTEKQYLKGMGISEYEYEKMDNVSKQEWKEEMRDGYYRKNWDRNLAKGRGASITVPGSNKQMRDIWAVKKKLIGKLLKIEKDKTENDFAFLTPEDLMYRIKTHKLFYKLINKIFGSYRVPFISIKFNWVTLIPDKYNYVANRFEQPWRPEEFCEDFSA